MLSVALARRDTHLLLWCEEDPRDSMVVVGWEAIMMEDVRMETVDELTTEKEARAFHRPDALEPSPSVQHKELRCSLRRTILGARRLRFTHATKRKKFFRLRREKIDMHPSKDGGMGDKMGRGRGTKMSRGGETKDG